MPATVVEVADSRFEELAASLSGRVRGEAPSQDAFGRHWTSAEAYLRDYEERLQAAKESGLAATEASQAVATTRARLAVEYATRALERAREYRNKAEVAARLAGALPAGLR